MSPDHIAIRRSCDIPMCTCELSRRIQVYAFVWKFARLHSFRISSRTVPYGEIPDMVMTSFNISVSMETESNSLLNCKLPKARNDWERQTSQEWWRRYVLYFSLVSFLHWGFEQEFEYRTTYST